MTRRHILGSTALAFSMLSMIGAAGATFAADAPAAAADSSASTTSVGEVVVTARGRSEKLIQVPISVQSFSADKLVADNITDINALQTQAGFVFDSQASSYSGGGRQFPTLIFRGLSTNIPGFEGGSSGALFVDGIYISGGLASVTLADASQVDVLKGPQNVYFGKNTFGGAINVITANPTEAYHASVTAGYSDKGSYDDVLTAEGAILPGLLTAKVTGEFFHQGAQYTSGDGGPLGEEDTKGVTVVLYATPTPDIWLKSRFHYSHDDDSTAQDGLVPGSEFGTPCAGFVNPYLCNGVPTIGSVGGAKIFSGTVIDPALITAIQNDDLGGSPQTWLDKVPRTDHSGLVRDNLQASLQGGAKLPYDATFQFSAGYNQAAGDDLTGADHSPTPYFITNTATINRDFEADARILTSVNEPLRAVIGYNHFQSVGQVSQGGEFFGFIASSFAPTYEETDKTDAVYGSLEYDILKSLTITGEVRYQHDHVSDLTGGLLVGQTFNHTLPRVILKYSPDKQTNVYISYSEGVQPPLLQTSYIAAQAATASSGHPYAQDALNGYGVTSPFTNDPKVRVWEVGLKHSMFENRVYFDIDYYNEFWDNALVSTYVFDAPGCPAVYPINYSAACPLGSSGQAYLGVSQNHIQGIEFDGTARVTDKFTTHLAVNWTDAIRKSYYDASWGPAFTSGVVPPQNGKRVDLVPEWQASLDGTYKDHLIADYDWYVHGVVNYTGKQYIEATDIASIPGYFHVNIAAGITKGNLSFEAFCSNLFDDTHYSLAVRFPENPAIFSFSEAYQGAIVTASNPRDFGFKISAKF